MATYIPGVTDYIPHVQPFKPDMQSIDYYLRTKTAQYDQGYNKINSVYTTLLNSPMLRDPDIQRRDEFFKTAMTEIQKISQADLSLNNNVSMAYNVFQPLIDDKNITSDMAKTKRYMDEKSRGEALRKCLDPAKCGGASWKTGDQALDYWADEYSKTNDTDALSFSDPRYVPYNGLTEKALKLIKEINPSVKSVGLSKNGQYIFTTTNGEQIIPHLADMLQDVLKNDPLIQDTYNTMAYVQMKSAIKNAAIQYGGDEKVAEDIIISKLLPQLDQYHKNKSKRLSADSRTAGARAEIKADQINTAGGIKSNNPLVQEWLDYTKQSQVLNQAADGHTTVAQNLSGEAMLNADRMAKRDRIIAAYSDQLMDNDIYSTATNYAMLTKEQDMKADPYQEKYYDHMLRINEMGLKLKGDIALAVAKGEIAKKGTTGTDLKGNKESSPEGAAVVDPLVRLHTQLEANTLANRDLIKTATGEVIARLQNEVEIGGPAGTSAAGYLKTINAAGDDFHKYLKIRALIKSMKSVHPGIDAAFTPLSGEIEERFQVGAMFAKNLHKNDVAARAWLISKNPKMAREISSMFDEQGYSILRPKYVSLYGEKMAKNVYDKVYPMYRGVMNLSDPKSGITVDLPSVTGGNLGNAGGIAQAGMRTPVDSYQGNTTQFRDMQDAVRAMDTDAFKGFVEGAHAVGGEDPSDIIEKGNDKWMYDVAKAFIKDYAGEVAKGGEGTRVARGDVVVNPISMNDINTSSFTIQPNESWIEGYVGSAKTKGLTYDAAKIRKGFTLLFDKRNAPEFFKKYEPSPKETLLNYGKSVTIKGYEDYGGQISFVPNQAGGFDKKGWFWDVDPKTGARYKNGDVTALGVPGGSIDYQYQVFQQALELNSRKVFELVRHPSNPSTRGPIYNVDDIQNQLDEYEPGPNAKQ